MLRLYVLKWRLSNPLDPNDPDDLQALYSAASRGHLKRLKEIAFSSTCLEIPKPDARLFPEAEVVTIAVLISHLEGHVGSLEFTERVADVFTQGCFPGVKRVFLGPDVTDTAKTKIKRHFPNLMMKENRDLSFF